MKSSWSFMKQCSSSALVQLRFSAGDRQNDQIHSCIQNSDQTEEDRRSQMKRQD